MRAEELPPGWSQQRTYRPDETRCVNGHEFRSEADCILPDGWDHFLCRRCLVVIR